MQRRTELVLLASYLATSFYFTYPLLSSGARLGIGDWDPILFHHASVMRSVYEYGQLPFWNPWYCGGNVLWQNAQVPLLTPVYLLGPFMPLAVAMKLNILLHYVIGFVGMHFVLTRAIRLSFAPAVFLVAATFTLAGGAALHIVVGHGTFLPYFYLPWVLYFFLSALQTGALRFAIGTGAMMALSIYAGGTHITFMAAIALGCFTTIFAALDRNWRPLALLAVAGMLAALYAAPKLVPMAAYVSDPGLVDIRYFIPAPDRVTPDMLRSVFTDAYQYPRMRLAGQIYGWHEYGNYLGPLGTLLIVASFLWVLTDHPLNPRNRLGIALAATTLVIFVLMLGEFGPYAPYLLLRKLPVFSQFRLPSRYVLILTLFATAMVGWAFNAAAPDRAGTPRLQRFVSVIMIVGACALAYWTRQHFGGAFPLPPLSSSIRFLARPPAPTHDLNTDGFGPDSPMLRAMFDRNQDVVRCNEPLMMKGEVRTDRPVAYAEGGARISNLVFTPNRIRFGLLASEADRIVLNQRYVNGWSSNAGPLEIDPKTGLAYLPVRPGTAAKIELSFTPPRLFTGLILFLIGLLGSAAIWRKTLQPS